MLKSLLNAPFTASAGYANAVARKCITGCRTLTATIGYTLIFFTAYLTLLTFAGLVTIIASLSWTLKGIWRWSTSGFLKHGGPMFWGKPVKSSVEDVLNVEDRGPVRSFYRAGKWWHRCCSRCNYRVHVVWSKRTLARYACPVCLSFVTDERDDDGGSDERAKAPVPEAPKRQGHPGGGIGKNRIAKYLKGNGDRKGPGSNERGLSALAADKGARASFPRMAGGIWR